LGYGGALGILKQREKVSFLEGDEALAAVEVTRELVGVRSGEWLEANNVKWLQSMS
jgi:hypothetical protein